MNTAANTLPIILLIALVLLPVKSSYAQTDGPILLGDALQLTESTETESSQTVFQANQADAAYVDVQSRTAVAMLYRNDYEATSEVELTWTGNVANCTPGSTPAVYRDAMLQRIKFFRSMAGVPVALSFSDPLNASAQRAALMMSANSALSHSPPTSWSCYSAEGAQTAGKSNLALGYAGVYAIDGYMQDPGNGNGPVGHRRWLLYPQTTAMGTGDVPANGAYRPANALVVINGQYGSPRPATRDGFVAWPPPGFVPYQVVYARWSFSYPGADFSAATVRLVSNGQTVAVTKEAIANGYGENTLAWLIDGMNTFADWALPPQDTSYQVQIDNVKINGVSQSFAYTVTVFDPANAAPTDIDWAPNTVDENAAMGTIYGSLQSVDADPSDTHTYALVAGEGDSDNARFSINGDSIIGQAPLDFEHQSSYSVRVQTTDSHGGQFTKAIAMTIRNVNETPTDVYLTQAPLQASMSNGANVGELYVVDDVGDSHQFALVAGVGDNDNAVFLIQGNALKVNGELQAPMKAFYRMRVQVTDDVGHVFAKELLVLGQPLQMFVPMLGR